MINKKYTLINIFALSLFLFDIYLKNISMSIGKEIFFLNNLFGFTSAVNYGVAFSWPINYYVIILFYLLVVPTLLWFLRLQYQEHSTGTIIAYTLIIFGAISNLIDRITVGGVVDYFYLQNFSVFNIADIMIVSGVFIIILSSLQAKNKLQ